MVEIGTSRSAARAALLFVGLYLAAAAAVSLAAVAVLNHLDGRLVPY